jgi:oligoribonuclease
MQKSPDNLIWLDLEMTGLDTNNDKIIEMATIVTDKNLNILAEGPVIAIFQENEILDEMDDWNTKQHTASGLVDRVRNSKIHEEEAEQATLGFLQEHLDSGQSPMCGSSICQDRRFLARCMPKLESFFHYRNLDVSAVKEIVKRWYPSVTKGVELERKHLALEDIKDSIRELEYYREKFFIDVDSED